MVQHTDQEQQECNQVRPSNLITPTISNDRSVNATLSVVNARSIHNKLQPFQNYVLDNNTTICVITEPGLSNEDNGLR